MDKWLNENFDLISNRVSWTAENNRITMCDRQVIIDMFAEAEINYASFADMVDSPKENPLVEGVNWGNHVRAWNNQGKFIS